MANSSTANGTLTLVGPWTESDIDALTPLLKIWESFEYGLFCSGPLSLENRSVGFQGIGRWNFSETLCLYDEWTRKQIEARKADSPLTAEAYPDLVERMHAGGLTLLLSFLDQEDGVGAECAETGAFSSDGSALRYEAVQLHDWTENALEAAVDYFTSFEYEKPIDRNEVQLWVQTRIDPTTDFEDLMDRYDEFSDDYERASVFFGYMPPFTMEDLKDFEARFAPKWESEWSNMLEFFIEDLDWDWYDEESEEE